MALTALYLASFLYIASQRLFWFDELFTVRIARLPQWTSVWSALAHAADALPPFYYLLVRLCGQLFGTSEVVTRMPSALAVAAGMLLTFDCARRLTNGLHGLIAFAVLTCTFLPYYGAEARSYALYFLTSSLALWIWTIAKPGKLSSAVWFGLVLAVGVTMHYYAFMCLLPYALWEIWTWRPGQRPSAKLVAGLIGVAVPVALLSPYILSFSRKFSSGYWNRPSFSELRAIYPQLFPDALLLLVLVAIWIALAHRQRSGRTLASPGAVESLGWLFLCIPLAGFVLAEVRTNAYFSRYFICVLPGVAVAFACLIWRHFRSARAVSLGIFLILAGWGGWKQLAVVRNPASIEATGARDFLAIEGKLRSQGKQYMVFSGPLIYTEAEYYSQAPQDCVLLLPPDWTPQPDPLRQSPDPYLHQRLLVNLSSYYPFQFWQLAELKSRAAETALIEPTPDVTEALRQAGFTLEVHQAGALRVVYLR